MVREWHDMGSNLRKKKWMKWSSTVKNLINTVRATYLGNKQTKMGGIPIIYCISYIHSFHLGLMTVLSWVKHLKMVVLPNMSYRCILSGKMFKQNFGI